MRHSFCGVAAGGALLKAGAMVDGISESVEAVIAEQDDDNSW